MLLTSADLTKLGSSVDLGDHSDNTVQWPKVNVAAGTKVMISILDDKDEEGWSGVVSPKSLPVDLFTQILSF